MEGIYGIYTVEVITADNKHHIEKPIAINELDAIDVVFAKYKRKNKNILDIKVVK